MASSTVRIDLPKNPGEIIKLAQDIVAKHTELGTASPLGGLKWREIQPQIEKADTSNKESKRLAKLAEAETADRDTALEIVNDFIRSARDILSGIHRGEMRRLGDYGFVVSAGGTAAAKKPAAPDPTGG